MLWIRKWNAADPFMFCLPGCQAIIGDSLRTRLICRYMEGPKFPCDELTKFCEAEPLWGTMHGISVFNKI